ncbi:MAG: hypothetical protein U1F68_03535 [Gammaproteobacteria bacterium]
MEPTAIFVRTAKGQHELVRGYFGLNPEQRKLLTRINGKTTVAELTQKLADHGSVTATLVALVDAGLIEAAVPGARVPAQTPKPQAEQPPPPLATVKQPDLAVLKPQIEAIIENHFGPMVAPYLTKLRACNDLEQLQKFLGECRVVIAEAINKSRAEAFWKRVSEMIGGKT